MFGLVIVFLSSFRLIAAMDSAMSCEQRQLDQKGCHRVLEASRYQRRLGLHSLTSIVLYHRRCVDAWMRESHGILFVH